MNSLWAALRLWGTILSLAVLAGALEAREKPIRLRNEIIATAPNKAKSKAAPSAQENRTYSGLFLIQFTGPLDRVSRQTLQNKGIDLIRYVPEDAFIARADQVTSSELLQLPFVRWAGDFKTGHKLHAQLSKRLEQGKASEEIAVSVLISPHAQAAEIAGMRKGLKQSQQSSIQGLGTLLRGTIEANRLQRLAESSTVLWLEPAPQMTLYDEVSSRIVAGEGTGHNTAMMDLGYDGSGVAIAVADSGLNNGDAKTMHPDLYGRVTAFFQYGNLTDAADEHSHGTHVAGIIAGNGAVGETDEEGALYGLGVAPNASLIAQRLFDGVGNYEAPPSYETLTRDAKNAGADIGSNSWGDDTQGRYDLSAAEFDALVRDADALTSGDQPYILEFSAGNAGPGRQTVGSPAVGKNVIATGASQNERYGFFLYEEGMDAMADFSSRGPCEDGRIKPDVVAPGTWIASLQSASATDENAWLPISQYYMYQGGTSQAGPQVSGAAAIFVQYYREQYGTTPSPALVKAALINSAVDMDDGAGTDPVPNKDEGWGRVDLTEIIGADRGVNYVDQTDRLITGKWVERRVVIASAKEPLKITLAYTDVPGFPGAIPALVNDLDLEVIGPNGTVYRGNQFDAGESAPDPTSYDRVNNVEAVHLRAPQPGEYVIVVRASNVAEDALQETTAVVDQDFALVISGSFLPPGLSAVFLNRSVFTVPDRIRITVLDPDENGSPAINVTISSSTEPSGESLLLYPTGSNGVFTNSIPTATGAQAADGILQIAHLDNIEIRYEDASSGATRTATAQADLLPPVITHVSSTDQFGRTVILWNTDEWANSRVYYGTSTSLNQAVTNRSFTTQHKVTLENLVAGQTYYFAVASTDPVGNASTNNNGGAWFSFVAPDAPAILLVDSIIPGADLFEPPLQRYTEPLNQIGVDYDVWRVGTLGSPLTADLRPYRVLIWRLPEASFAEPTWTPSEQQAIREYLAGGGSLFVASMEVCSRLDSDGSADFRENILQVSSYTEDLGVYGAKGVNNDSITDGLSLSLDYEDYWTIDWLADTITPNTNAVGIFLDTVYGDYVGLKYPRTGVDSPWRLVYLSFPFDAVVDLSSPNNKTELLRRILTFLAPGLNGEGSIAFDRGAYTLPSLITLEVADTDLSGQGEISITLHSTTEPNGQLLMVKETSRPGIFRGTIPLMSATNAPESGRLRARHGDLVWARYFDASSGQHVEASVPVDTLPPVISEVDHEADYVAAFVRWNTSEPADALVQYGESLQLPIFRTAYDSRMQTSHELLLTGLQPNHTYYYRVVSRDAAGNAVIDDNGGAHYSFNTLLPRTPPWADDLENGSTNWTVIEGDFSEAGWTLGAPNNRQETAAHSPLNAWGSNLKGRGIDYEETWLFSPAVDLTRANQATLRFWQSYDFSAGAALEAIEGGELYLYTNLFAEPVTLLSLLNETPGWEETTIDLSPYSGQVVFLAWYYVFFNLFLENPQPPGWMIDDISLTATTVMRGTVQVVNNLAQSSYVITGPVTHSGSGWNLTLTNAPPGEYSINYNNVPYYLTPPLQTHTLVPDGTITFLGNYTFVDVNTNGMADSWEQETFGEVSEERTTTTDSDHDGSTDYAEFMAGTDPNELDSKLEIAYPSVSTNGDVSIQWAAVEGRSYRILASSDAVSWTPITDWRQSTNGLGTVSLSKDAIGVAFLFRLEVRP